MSNSDSQSVQMNGIPLSVITAREPVQDNPWITERWRVLGVVAGVNKGAGQLERLLVRTGAEGEQYLWTGLVLRLRQVEVDSYYYNLIGDNPSVYVYCACDDTGEPRPRHLTVDYIDAMANSESGNSSFAVPMPPDVYRRVEQFVLEYYVPDEPKMKRKHERESKDSGVRGDD